MQPSARINPVEEAFDLFFEIFAGWKFYEPKEDICKSIMVVNRKIREEYFEKKYKDLANQEFTENRDFDRNLAKFEKKLESEISELRQREHFSPAFVSETREDSFMVKVSRFFVGNKTEPSPHTNSVLFFQKNVSENIYDHFALLSLNDESSRISGFSIKRELTRRMAANFGLDLYLRKKLSPELTAEAEEVLTRLAADFEEWFITEKKGYFETTFGRIFSVNKYRKAEKEGKIPGDEITNMVLIADVLGDQFSFKEAARSNDASA